LPHCDIPYGWIYVVLLMSFTEPSIWAGIATLFFYGIAPLALVLYVFGTPARRRRRKHMQAERQRDADEEE
jgi:hypothetical protein